MNSVEIGIIVMVCISIVSGLAQLTLYVYKYYQTLTSNNYRTNHGPKPVGDEIATNRDNQVTLKKLNTADESHA